MQAARAECDAVVVSLFVNPTQFGAGRGPRLVPARPRTETSRSPTEIGADLVFAPRRRGDVSGGVPDRGSRSSTCRDAWRERPGRATSAAVATVCLKLFTIVRPDRAYFGQKDAQQVAVVERMAHDLALELEIRVVPTVRDADGLALSSRNVHLTPEQREAALEPAARARGRPGGTRTAARTPTRSPARCSLGARVSRCRARLRRDGPAGRATRSRRRHSRRLDPPHRQRHPGRSPRMTTRPTPPGSCRSPTSPR